VKAHHQRLPDGHGVLSFSIRQYILSATMSNRSCQCPNWAHDVTRGEHRPGRHSTTMGTLGKSRAEFTRKIVRHSDGQAV
jgi:hypothetical protein